MARLGSRLDCVDVLRGCVMVLMALDHVRDFFHRDAILFDPTDLTQTNAAVFLTRWVTHFCAPVFVFLAGTGALLSRSRGKTRNQVARFLLTRGLWLVLLEVTWVQCLGWNFGFDYHQVKGKVLWALGWSMVALAGLVYLPVWAVSIFGGVMIALHNLLDAVQADPLGPLGWIWAILHSGQTVAPVPGFSFTPVYPLVPWIGVMAVGYGFGTLLLWERKKRRKWLLALGVLLTVAFVAIRLTNLYGDPQPWGTQANEWFTLFSFVNCEKYPPSLLFLLMTLGPAVAALALLDRQPGPLGGCLLVFGRVPLFYYLLHLPLIHALAVGFSYVRYGQASWLFENTAADAPPFPEGYGLGLAAVYLVWLSVVVALFPVCRWFADVKRRHPSAWLSYF